MQEKLHWTGYNAGFDYPFNEMDKDLLKGIALVIAVVVAVGALFLAGSKSGPQKAKCIANALKNGVAYGKIEIVCGLTQRK